MERLRMRMRDYKKSIRDSIKDFDSKNDVTMRSQKIKQLIEVSSASEIKKMPKWYFNI